MAVRLLLERFATRKIISDRHWRDRFYTKLEREVQMNHSEDLTATAEYIWTSAIKLMPLKVKFFLLLSS